MKRVLLFIGDSKRYYYLVRALRERCNICGVIIQRTMSVSNDRNFSDAENKLLKFHFDLRDKTEEHFFRYDKSKCLDSLNILYIDGINEQQLEIVNFVSECQPELLITYGVGYIKEEILDAFPSLSFNMHNGITPWYKGAACHFWPFYFLEPTYVGCTLHYLKKKLDGGKVVFQSRPELEYGDNVHSLSCKASKKMCNEIGQLIDVLCEGSVEGISPKAQGKMFYSRDFRPEHLHLIYEVYNNNIVDMYLDGALHCNEPILINSFEENRTMICNHDICGKDIRIIGMGGGVNLDYSKYLAWMSDEKVIEFLYSGSNKWDIDELQCYIHNVNLSDDAVIFGIFTLQDNNYIGNIKVGPINFNHKVGEIGYMIGEKEVWGKGYGTEAVNLICKYAFKEIGLHKVTSGCNELNLGSNKVLQKNGFVLEGVLREQEYVNNIGYVAKNIYGLLKRDYLLKVV